MSEWPRSFNRSVTFGEGDENVRVSLHTNSFTPGKFRLAVLGLGVERVEGSEPGVVASVDVEALRKIRDLLTNTIRELGST